MLQNLPEVDKVVKVDSPSEIANTLALKNRYSDSETVESGLGSETILTLDSTSSPTLN